MKRDYYHFKGVRNPERGGLYMEVDEDFPRELKRVVEANCLEVMASEYTNFCTAFFPVSEEYMAVIYAVKNRGNETDHRVHDDIEGYIVPHDEVKELLQQNTEKGTEDILSTMTPGEMLGVIRTTEMAVKKHQKIHLQVELGKERQYQLALYELLSPGLRKHFACIANGECTLTDADVLITHPQIRISYQDERKYKTLTWEEYKKYGEYLISKRDVRQEEEWYDAYVQDCMNYIEDERITENIISTIRTHFRGLGVERWQRFQADLRLELSMLRPIDKKKLDRYLKILCFSYENYQGQVVKNDEAIISIPYDVCGITRFLKDISGSRRKFREYRRHLIELFVMYQYNMPMWEVKCSRKIVEKTLGGEKHGEKQ